MSDFTMSTNAHHPRVKRVARIDDAGTLSITLGGTGYTHVAILTTDEGWRQIVRDVDQQIARMDTTPVIDWSDIDSPSKVGGKKMIADTITELDIIDPEISAARMWVRCENCDDTGEALDMVRQSCGAWLCRQCAWRCESEFAEQQQYLARLPW